jgi:hypothetical protein
LTLFHVTGLYIPGIHFDCWENLYEEDRDFNEETTNINTTTRQQYVVEFMAEHQMYTKEMGPTKGKDCTSIDYILFQESYREQISSIKKIDDIANVSEP